MRFHDLHSICPELIIVFESGIEADGPRRFDLRHLHDEVFREIVFEADEECIVVNGVHFFTGDLLLRHRCCECKARFKEEFVENLLIGAVRVDMIDEEFYLFFNLTVRRNYPIPDGKVGGAEFEDAETKIF